jgi:hypothetical protein
MAALLLTSAMVAPTAHAGNTHLIGSFPANNTVVDGTGRFHKTSGRVRVSGAAELSQYPEQIVFDHLFVMDFD